MEYNPPNDIIRRVGEFMREPLSLIQDKLTRQLINIEALRFELSDERTKWHKLLSEKKNQMLYPKDKDKTELDRKVMLNASVAVIEKDYLFLVALEEMVKERLELGRELLMLF